MGYSYNKFLNPIEIELKFAILPEDVDALESNSHFVAAGKRCVHQVTTYFDTADATLDKAGLTLRVRRDDRGHHVQTVKSCRSGFELAAKRSEWEWPVEGDFPDIDKFKEIPRLAELGKQIDGRLLPVFLSDIQRTIRIVPLEGMSSVEAVIDIGTIASGDASIPVSELELELKSGEAASIYKFAAELQKTVSLRITAESKAARGWNLRTGQTEGAREAHLPAFPPHIRAVDGIHHVINATLHHLIVNIAPTLRGDPEGLHQMRRALRDSRAALKLFGGQLDKVACKAFETELVLYGKIFGEARCWDVFCLQTMPSAMADLPAERLRDLNAVADVRRKISHDAVVEAVQSRSFTELVLKLAVWTTPASEQFRGDGGEKHPPLIDIAHSLLDKAATKSRRRGQGIGGLSAKQLHRLRKAFDQLGNDVKFLSSLYPTSATKSYREGCKRLKSALGSNNDAVDTRNLASTLVTEDRPDLAIPAQALGTWSERGRRDGLKGVRKAHRAFRKIAEFW